MSVSVVMSVSVAVGETVVHVGVVMSLELEMSDSLGLEVVLVILSAVVLPGGRLGASQLGSKDSEFVVDEFALLQLVDVEVSNGVDGGLLEFGSGSRAPVGFDTVHVPLVNDRHGLLALGVAVEGVEDVEVLLVDENSLLVGGEFLEKLDEPVRAEAVNGFGESLAAVHVERSVYVEEFSLP